MEAKFDRVHADLAPTFTGRLKPTPADYHARGAIFLLVDARFSGLLKLPEIANLAEALDTAMNGIVDTNPNLAGVLRQGYGRCRIRCCGSCCGCWRRSPSRAMPMG